MNDDARLLTQHRAFWFSDRCKQHHGHDYSMAQKTGICSACGQTDVVVTVEHVFPESWHPDGFPPSQMLTVPSCSPCNHESGKREARIFLDLVSTLPVDARTESLIKRAQRSADPTAGKSVRDASHRRGVGARFMQRVTVVPPNATPSDALWMRTSPKAGPVGETADGAPVIGVPLLRLPHETVSPVIVKFLRGV